ncbi:Protein prenyltransferase alpha subunit repeat-containing protein 1-B [Paramyrothecium foliicola]|nr:Protein prenyltransferase alpha subunit repeat-containing protein 1-B [Paramyrothecium foliicola]
MSRALDKGVKEALKLADHGKAFSDIADVLTHVSGDLLEVEFLGKSHVLDEGQILLKDGNAVAIPKIHVIQAFIVAHQTFKKLSVGEELPDAAVLKATAVMLLMDPEHLTAANFRKRVIDRATRAGRSDVKHIIQHEKLFTDSLLTSRLHRHTKSPNLWNHRRWLIQQSRQLNITLDIVQDFRSVIFVSGERHPRNYYAWCHARHLISTAGPDAEMTEETRLALLSDTNKWCVAHHDDISGWMFLKLLLADPREAVAIVGETLKLAESFHWRNESVWYFLRNMLTVEPVAEALGEEARRVKAAMLQGTEAGSKERKALDQVN